MFEVNLYLSPIVTSPSTNTGISFCGFNYKNDYMYVLYNRYIINVENKYQI